MGRGRLAVVLGVTVVVSMVVSALLVSIFERKQEARQPLARVTEVQPGEPDPAIWGQNFRPEYDGYLRGARTADLVNYKTVGKYEGPVPFSRLDWDPNLRRLFAGYPFAIEYNEERGHPNALEDVKNTKRLGDTKPGTCLTCKTPSVPAMMQQLGTEKFYATPMKDLIAQFNPKHSIACADCHDSQTMALTITRPAFKEAMAARGIDVSKATHQEMRTYVCAQCHVEYYFKGDGKYLVFPWQKGLGIENIEAYYEELNFKDWDHEETKTPLVKMQHPDFEMWSSGVHARAGVACPDCHMAYIREGATKVSDHWVRSPLLNITNSCTTCHRTSEEEMRSRVIEIQDRTWSSMQRTEKAILGAQDAIKSAMDKGATDALLKESRGLHRRAYIRWDFVAAESSMGFHSPQEATRILGDSADFARQAEIAARAVIGAR